MTRTIISSMTPAAAALASEALMRLGVEATLRAFADDVCVVTYRSADTGVGVRVAEQLAPLGSGATIRLFDSGESAVGQSFAANAYLDFETDDAPIACSHCIAWWAETVVDPAGALVLREWHQQDCPVVLAWS